MGGASTLRDAVEAAGSRLRMSVGELRDAFGMVSLTSAGRERITRELGAMGMRLEPPLARRGPDERITIVGPGAGRRPVPAPDDPEPAELAPLAPSQRPRRAYWSNRRRTVMAGVGAGLLVILLAAVVGWKTGTYPESGSARAPATPGPAATMSPPTAASTREHPRVVAALQRVDGALAREDPRSARRFLSELEPAVLSADADLALQARILRNRVRLTESYLAATALAEAGRYGEARQTMLALVPFRDAGVRARQYGVEIAKGLVTQARTEVAVRPDRALELLERARDIAPSLSAITEVRTLATGG